jgi:hypothetical protein
MQWLNTSVELINASDDFYTKIPEACAPGILFL